eukprot:6194692-Pleurochrysis_carterae.AAC.1
MRAEQGVERRAVERARGEEGHPTVAAGWIDEDAELDDGAHVVLGEQARGDAVRRLYVRFVHTVEVRLADLEDGRLQVVQRWDVFSIWHAANGAQVVGLRVVRGEKATAIQQPSELRQLRRGKLDSHADGVLALRHALADVLKLLALGVDEVGVL